MLGRGIRLRNVSSVECYLNTAVNTVVTNDILLSEIMKPMPLLNWVKGGLKDNKIGFLESELTNNYEDLVRELDTFLSSSQGCRDIHGDLCFQSRKREYNKNRDNLLVLEEVRNMCSNNSEIQDALYLKELLKKHFGMMFGSNEQNDAQDTYLCILECAPDINY